MVWAVASWDWSALVELVSGRKNFYSRKAADYLIIEYYLTSWLSAAFQRTLIIKEKSDFSSTQVYSHPKYCTPSKSSSTLIESLFPKFHFIFRIYKYWNTWEQTGGILRTPCPTCSHLQVTSKLLAKIQFFQRVAAVNKEQLGKAWGWKLSFLSLAEKLLSWERKGCSESRSLKVTSATHCHPHLTAGDLGSNTHQLPCVIHLMYSQAMS